MLFEKKTIIILIKIETRKEESAGFNLACSVGSNSLGMQIGNRKR